MGNYKQFLMARLKLGTGIVRVKGRGLVENEHHKHHHHIPHMHTGAGTCAHRHDYYPELEKLTIHHKVPHKAPQHKKKASHHKKKGGSIKPLKFNF